MAALDARASLLSAATLALVLSFGSGTAAEQTAALAAGAKPEGATTQPAPHITLAAHRAVYDLTLLKATGNKSPTGARGRIAFDFSGSACEGYVQNFRQLTELQPADGPTRLSDMRSATFEDGTGRSFDFKMQTTVDGGGPELVDGQARKAADGEVSISLTKPKTTKFDTDPDAIFPTEHLKRILAAAEAGRHILEVKVYDGSESGDKLYETTTVIGQPIVTPATEKPLHIPLLEGMRRWPVSIAYFDAGKKDEAPNYTLAFDLYENGISRGLRLDYGDFVLAGEMTSLELLPEKVCSK
jgi:hypothetical protein